MPRKGRRSQAVKMRWMMLRLADAQTNPSSFTRQTPVGESGATDDGTSCNAEDGQARTLGVADPMKKVLQSFPKLTKAQRRKALRRMTKRLQTMNDVAARPHSSAKHIADTPTPTISSDSPAGQAEDDQRCRDEPRLAQLGVRREAARRQEEDVTQQPPHSAVHSHRPLATESLQGGAVGADSSPLWFSIIPQAVSGPSGNSGFPIISDVFSLSTVTLRGKRTRTSREHCFHQGPSDTPSSADASPLNSLLAPISDSNETDDDVIFLN